MKFLHEDRINDPIIILVLNNRLRVVFYAFQREYGLGKLGIFPRQPNLLA
jgi:hypothetical protein